jgi:hypothetical protein
VMPDIGKRHQHLAIKIPNDANIHIRTAFIQIMRALNSFCSKGWVSGVFSEQVKLFETRFFSSSASNLGKFRSDSNEVSPVHSREAT